jgi:hypothetical protein
MTRQQLNQLGIIEYAQELGERFRTKKIDGTLLGRRTRTMT